MKKLILVVIPIIAGCMTQPTAIQNTATLYEVMGLRNDVRVLRQELNDFKSQKAYYEFKSGRRISKPKDLRDDLPKGVTR